jgi:hypothetical protein
MHVSVPELDVQQARLTSISVGRVGIGPITVGELVLQNADFAFSAAHAVLRDLTVTVTLRIKVGWHIHIPLPWPFDDIDLGDDYDLGAFSFSMPPIGDVTIPGLNNIQVHIPSLTAQNMSVAANPLTNLQLHNAVADQVRARNVVLPTAGFTLAGLTLNSVQGDNVSVPAASIGEATVGHVRGDPASIGAFSLSSLTLPAAQVPTISGTAPFDVPVTLQPRTLSLPAGILHLSLTITPSALSHVEHLEISNANASASVGSVVLNNVVLPYDVLNLTLSQIGITSIGIPTFAAS